MVTDQRRSHLRLGLAALMAAGGCAHFAAPALYDPLIPSSLGRARVWVYASGAAELLVGALLAWSPTSRTGARLATIVLLVIFPGNVKMALDGGHPGAARSRGARLAAWGRLPLQVPLVWAAWNLGRRPRGGDTTPDA